MKNLLTSVEPVYPPLARQARIQGVVRFVIVINTKGQVASVQVTSGHPLLIQAATAAVKQWTYRPTLFNGRPAVVITVAEVPFSLN